MYIYFSKLTSPFNNPSVIIKLNLELNWNYWCHLLFFKDKTINSRVWNGMVETPILESLHIPFWPGQGSALYIRTCSGLLTRSALMPYRVYSEVFCVITGPSVLLPSSSWIFSQDVLRCHRSIRISSFMNYYRLRIASVFVHYTFIIFILQLPKRHFELKSVLNQYQITVRKRVCHVAMTGLLLNELSFVFVHWNPCYNGTRMMIIPALTTPRCTALILWSNLTMWERGIGDKHIRLAPVWTFIIDNIIQFKQHWLLCQA